MKTLLVPDIHEEYLTLTEVIEPMFDEVDRVVLLGDYFDTFGPRDTKRMCYWLKDHLGDKKFTFLMGNHDCHYRWPIDGMICSGYKPVSQLIIDENLTREDWAKIGLVTEVGPFLVSHAGFRPETYHLRGSMDDAIAYTTSTGRMHPMFEAGYARGGYAPYGGPTWLDFRLEYKDVPNVPQIVGHTYNREHEIQEKGLAFCIDTGLHSVVIIDERPDNKVDFIVRKIEKVRL